MGRRPNQLPWRLGQTVWRLGRWVKELGNDEALDADPVSHLFDFFVKFSTIGRAEQATIKEL